MAENQVGQAFVTLRYAFDRLQRDFKEAETKIKGHTDAMEGRFGKLGAGVRGAFEGLKSPIAQVGSALAGIGTVSVFSDIIRTSGDFEARMNKLGALVEGISEDQFAALRKQAIKLGADTQFGATEAANAMGVLAAAGFKVEDIMKSVPGVLQLAAAAEVDLATAATQAADTLSQFRLPAEEIGRVNNVIAATANKSTAGMQDIGLALKYAGAAATSAGVPLEDVSAAIGILAKGGVRGEQAGTGLRSMLATLQQMENPPNRIAEAMTRLGINFSEVDLKTNSFQEVIVNLSKKVTKGVDILDLFGLEASSSANTLLGAASAGEEFRRELDDIGGEAQRVADSNMKGFKGAVLELSGAFESLKINIGDSGLLDGVTSLVRVLADFVGKLGELNPDILKFSGALAGIVGIVAPVAGAVGFLALAFGGISLPVVAVTGALLALGAAAITFSDDIGRGFAAAKSYLGTLVADWDGSIGGLGAVLGRVSSDVASALSGVVDQVRAWAGTVGTTVQQGLANIVPSAAAAVGGLAQAVVDALGKDVAAIGQAAANLFGSIVTAAKAALLPVGQISRDATLAFGRSFAEGMGVVIGGAIASLATFAQTLSIGVLKAAAGVIKAWVQGLGQGGDPVEAIAAVFQRVGAFLLDLPRMYGAYVIDFGRGLVKGIGDAFGADLLGAIESGLSRQREVIVAALGHLTETALSAAATFASDFGASIGTTFATFATNIATSLAQVGITFVMAVGGWASTIVSAIGDLAGQVLAGIGSMASGAVSAAAGFARDFVAAIASAFGANLSSAFNAGLGSLVSLVAEGFGRVRAEIDKFIAVVRTIATAIVGPMRAAAEAIRAPIKAIKDEFAGLVPNLDAAGKRLDGFWAQQKRDIAALATDPVAAVKGLVGGLLQETGKLDAPLADVQRFNEQVQAAFAGTTDAVVGRSHWPELVAGVGTTTNKLKGLMVDPVVEMLGQVEAAFGDTRGEAVRQVQQIAAAAAAMPGVFDAARGESVRQMREMGSVAKATATLKPANSNIGVPAPPAADTGDEKRRAERIADIRTEIAELQRLNAAQGISVAEYTKVAAQIEGERAARALGIEATKAERDAVSALTIEQNKLQQSLDWAKQAADLEAEVAGLERVNAASAQSAQAADTVTRALTAEQAVRAAGLTMQDQQGQALYQLTMRQQELGAAIQATSQIQGLEIQVAGMQQMALAAGQSAVAAEQLRVAQLGEQAVRQAGLTLDEEKGQRLYELTVAQETLSAAIERSGRVQTLREELGEMERLNEASLLGQAAYRETAKAIEVERAVREAGLGATRAEIAAIRELTAAKFDAQDAVQRRLTYDPMAGAADSMRRYSEEAQEYGRITSGIVSSIFMSAERGLADVIMASTGGFDDMKEAGKKALDQFLKDILNELVRFMAQQIVLSFMKAFVSGGTAGAYQQQPNVIGGAGGGARPYALGGVPPGRGISAFSGMIVSRPTLFAFARGAGLMGEKGKEGILPLASTRGGKLGVHAIMPANDEGGGRRGGGDVKIVNQVINQSNARVEQKQERGPGGETIIRTFVRNEVKSTLRGGGANREMDDQFAVKPRLNYG